MKYAMFTFTSCAWFFGDISRIEPVQNMKYAKKALDIMSLYDQKRAQEIEKDLLMILRNGISNIREQKDGEHIWKNSVLPAVVNDNRFAAFYMINLLITSRNEKIRIFNREIDCISELEEFKDNDKGIEKS